jgi:hypothetical protein
MPLDRLRQLGGGGVTGVARRNTSGVQRRGAARSSRAGRPDDGLHGRSVGGCRRQSLKAGERFPTREGLLPRPCRVLPGRLRSPLIPRGCRERLPGGEGGPGGHAVCSMSRS